MSLESGYMKKERKEKNSLHNHNINPFLLTKTQFLHNFSDIILVLISSVVLYPIKFCLSKKQCVYIYAKVTALYCLAKPVRFFKTPVHNYSKTVWNGYLIRIKVFIKGALSITLYLVGSMECTCLISPIHQENITQHHSCLKLGILFLFSTYHSVANLQNDPFFTNSIMSAFTWW